MKTMEDLILPLCPVTVNRTLMNGARAIEVTPSTIAPRHQHRVLMNIHGGAYVYGEGMVVEAAVAAHFGQLKVVAVDYRVPPDHCFPPIWKTRRRFTALCLSATVPKTSRFSALQRGALR